ncbi:unnamed protein product [Caenorhabditis brenneri]
MADWLNLIGSAVILVEAVLGITFSSLVIFIYFYGSSEKTSFNLICLSRAINNVIVLGFNFLILDFPTALLSKNFWPPTVETLIIVITVNLYMVNEYQTILIAVNRFIAIFIPLHYNKLFSNKVAAVFLAALYLERGYSSVTKLITLFEYDCLSIWSIETFQITYKNATCTLPTGFDGYLIIILPLAVFALTILLNLMTFTKILRFYLSHNMDSDTAASVKNNIRLFFQTVLQDSLFFVDVLFTFKLSRLSDHRVWYFISTVFVWETIHMLDGLIMLMFSDRITEVKAKFRKTTKSTNSIGDRQTSDFRAVTTSHHMPDIA